jgi:hypothetical protein
VPTCEDVEAGFALIKSPDSCWPSRMLGVMAIWGEKSLLGLGSRLSGWVQLSPSRALGRGMLSGLPV